MDVIAQFTSAKICLLAFCFLVFGTISCKEEKKETIPAGLIGKDTMVMIISEFHLLEASLGVKIFEDKKIIETRNLLKAKIYKDYGVSKEKFFKSYRYYAQNNQLIDSIYTNVISEISKRQAEQLKK